jgi:hypothetical protein
VDYLPEDPRWIPDAFEMVYQAWKDKLDVDAVDRRSGYPRLAIGPVPARTCSPTSPPSISTLFTQKRYLDTRVTPAADQAAVLHKRRGF